MMVNNAVRILWDGGDGGGPTVGAEDSGSESTGQCSSDGSSDDEDLSYELQQATKIFHDFLLEKHSAVTAPFWNPTRLADGSGDKWKQEEMCLRQIDAKFVNQEYRSITDFVADIRLMLENCYRFHGAEHWISKQAQKLEMILEQKLILLPRTLREKTSLTVTSKGRFGSEEDKVAVSSTSRRRSTPRSLTSSTLGGTGSIMLQALRREQQQKAKEEKRQREQEKREAEETSAKEVVDWEVGLLSEAQPWPIDSLWELPAIGHFLCLAQAPLNLPEIVFYELERCLLMPRCSPFLARIMTSLLCQPYRRATLHRRAPLTYRRWEAKLRQRVLGWYGAVGGEEDQGAAAEQLGLCNQFFHTLGESSPLEEAAFHLLPFNQRVWLLKGLCDNVYETQKEVQDAVLAQPIHECRESILGYDSQENAYIHFPHFCGADLRIYCQSPFSSPYVPPPRIAVKVVSVSKPRKSPSPCGEGGAADSTSEAKGPTEDVEADTLRDPPWGGGGSPSKQVNGVGGGESETEGWRESSHLLSPRKDSGRSWTVKVEPGTLEDGDTQMEAETDSSSPACHTRNHGNPQKSSSAVSSTRLKDGLLKAGRGASQTSSLEVTDQSSCFQNSAGRGGEVKNESCGSKIPRTPQTSRLHTEQEKLSGKEKQEGKISLEKKRMEPQYNGTRSQTRAMKVRTVREVRNSPKDTVMPNKKENKTENRKPGQKEEQKRLRGQQSKDLSLQQEPTFKLVCSSLDELRVLITKTEDEIDKLDGTKKRCAKWKHKKASVKELHITLIRLLNELSPWEPKLIKACVKNRVRLKKDFDDFKQHPEYSNFVREDLTEDEHSGKVRCPSVPLGQHCEIVKSYKEEASFETNLDGPQQQEVKASAVVCPAEEVVCSEGQSPVCRGQTFCHDYDLNHKKRLTFNIEESTVSSKTTEEPRTEKTSMQISVASSTRRQPFEGQYRSSPIQALLVKRVGDKVTLTRHTSTRMPQNPGHHDNIVSPLANLPNKHSQIFGGKVPAPVLSNSTPLTCSPVAAPHCSIVQRSPAAPVAFKEDDSLKLTVQPTKDSKNEQKLTQKVVILPTNPLVPKSENCDMREPVLTPNCKTALIPSGFVVPVRHAAPLKSSPVHQTLSPSTSLKSNTTSISSSTNQPSIVTATDTSSHKSSSTVSKDPGNSESNDVRQELKTVCIRDSQSILVTTRGGNTGVVKVQASEAAGAPPASSVFTLSPQFQALLVSMAASPVPATLTSKHTTPSSTTAGSSSKTAENVVSSNSQSPVATKPVTQSVLPALTGPAKIGVPKCEVPTAPKRAPPEQLATSQAPPQKIFLITRPVPDTSIHNTACPPIRSDISSKFMLVSQKSASSAGVAPQQPLSEATALQPTTVKPITHTQAEAMNPNSINSSYVVTHVHQAPPSTTGLNSKLPVVLSCSDRKPGLPEATSRSAAPTGAPGVTAPNTSRLLSMCSVSGSSPAQQTTGIKTIAGPDLIGSPPLVLTTGHRKPSDAPLPSLPASFLGLPKTNQTSSVASLPLTPLSTGLKVKGQVQPIQGLQGGTHAPCPPKSVSETPLKVVPSLTFGVTRVAQATNTPVLQTPSTLPAPTASAAKAVSQKVVLNTTSRLAPGTEILISNARFVVPAQGLEPGSHVVLISSHLPATDTRSATNLRTPGLPAGGASVSQGSSVGVGAPVSNAPLTPSLDKCRIVTARPQAPQPVLRLPVPVPLKIDQRAPTPVALRPLRTPSLPLSPAQIRPLLGLPLTTAEHSGSSPVNVPRLLSPAGQLSTPIQVITNPALQISTTTASQVQGTLSSSAHSTILHVKPASEQSGARLMSIPVTLGTVTSTPTLALPVVSAQGPRQQRMPVATVRPIGGTLTNSHTSSILTWSPLANTVIMTSCQPVANAAPDSMALPVAVESSPQGRKSTDPKFVSANMQ